MCVLCGKRPATTKDHIPPKGIFPKPRPNDLVSVPACFKCNLGASKHDELFRVYLSMHVGIDSPSTKALWEKHAYRSLRHNRKLHKTLLSRMKEVDLKTEGGVYLGRRTIFLWDSEAHDLTVKRIIKGLYYYHYGLILPSNSYLRVNWHKSLTPEMEEMSRDWAHHSVTNGNFQYRYGRAAGEEHQSIWLFQFYEKHWASGHTNLE